MNLWLLSEIYRSRNSPSWSPGPIISIIVCWGPYNYGSLHYIVSMLEELECAFQQPGKPGCGVRVNGHGTGDYRDAKD